MIDLKFINEKLEKYANNSNKVKSFKKAKGKPPKSPVHNDGEKYGEQMKEILLRHITPLVKSMVPEDINITVSTKEKDGYSSVILSFREGCLHRDSLYKEGYEDGLENIVLLFKTGYAKYASNGYKLQHVPFKRDETTEIIGRKQLLPNDYLNRAINEFNQLNGEVAKAQLLGKYK